MTTADENGRINSYAEYQEFYRLDVWRRKYNGCLDAYKITKERNKK